MERTEDDGMTGPSLRHRFEHGGEILCLPMRPRIRRVEPVVHHHDAVDLRLPEPGSERPEERATEGRGDRPHRPVDLLAGVGDVMGPGRAEPRVFPFGLIHRQGQFDFAYPEKSGCRLEIRGTGGRAALEERAEPAPHQVILRRLGKGHVSRHRVRCIRDRGSKPRRGKGTAARRSRRVR